VDNKDSHQPSDKVIVEFEVELDKQFISTYEPVLAAFLSAQAAHINHTGTIIPFQSTSTSTSFSRPRNLFRRAGEGYEISFNGKPPFWLAATTGLQFLEILLRNPNGDIHVSRMLTIIGETGDSNKSLANASFDLSTDIGLKEPGIDSPAYRTVKAALEELRSEIAENGSQMTPGRKEKLEDEILKLEKYLRNARRRRINAEVNKQRIRVKNAITDALSKIRFYDFRLYQYLDIHIETGTFCRYRSEGPPTPWQFE